MGSGVGLPGIYVGKTDGAPVGLVDGNDDGSGVGDPSSYVVA